jgi:hypothetical protein
MDVAAERPVVARIFDKECLVSTLIKMSCTTIAFGVLIGVTGQPMLHARGEIGLWGLNQGMDVIGQPGERQHNPAASLYFLLKPFGKSFVVLLVVKQLLSPVAPRNEVVVRTGELDSRRTRYDGV